MNGGILTSVDSLLITVLSIGAGYLSLLLGFYRSKKISQFLKLGSFDKLILSTILGLIIFAGSMILFRFGYTTEVSQLLRYTPYLVIGEVYLIILTGIIVSLLLKIKK